MMPAVFQYTPFYCEENIWHLAREECFCKRETMVVMISGKGRFRKVWFQRNAESPESPVFWDYHVILLTFDSGWWVWDLDTTLGLPVPAEAYFSKSFLPSNINAMQTDVILRLISAEVYVQTFSSDRSHMRLQTGEWIAPPPEWPSIQQGRKSNLLDWLDIERAAPGQVYTLAEFLSGFPGVDSEV